MHVWNFWGKISYAIFETSAKHVQNILEVVTCKIKHENIFVNVLQMFYFTRNHGLASFAVKTYTLFTDQTANPQIYKHCFGDPEGRYSRYFSLSSPSILLNVFYNRKITKCHTKVYLKLADDILVFVGDVLAAFQIKRAAEVYEIVKGFYFFQRSCKHLRFAPTATVNRWQNMNILSANQKNGQNVIWFLLKNLDCHLKTNISQGSVATPFRCGGICNVLLQISCWVW